MDLSRRSNRIRTNLIVVAVLSLFIGAVTCATADTLPLEINLNGEWKFAYMPGLGGKNPPQIPLEDRFKVKMPVPGYWDDNLRLFQDPVFWRDVKFEMSGLHHAEFPRLGYPPVEPLLYVQGIGFYKRMLDIPAGWQGRTLVLNVGGVKIDAWVWVNGQFIAHHLGGQSFPLEWPLSDKIKFGTENEIVIAVANCFNRTGGCDIRSAKGLGAGITRPVHLKVSGGARIADLYVRPLNSNRNLRWNVELEGNYSGANLDWAIEEMSTGRVLGSGKTAATGPSVAWSTDTFGMKTWSDHDPNLYMLRVTLSDSGKTVDLVKQRFGLRTLVRDGLHLRLNGRLVMLRGVTESYGFTVTRTAPTETSYYRRLIRNLKEIGFNWLRFHTWVPNEEYLQAADELGMMVQVEKPSGFKETEWRGIIRHCRKHPSVVLYCYGNEGNLDEETIPVVRRYAEHVRDLAPDALYSPMEALRGVEYYYKIENMGSDYVEKPYVHNPRRLNELKEFSDVFESYSWGMLSYDSVHGDWRELDRRYVSYERPILSHELCIDGTYPDLGQEYRYEGTRTGANPFLYEEVKKILREAGLLHNAATYTQNSCKLNAITRKYAFETARKCKYIMGYDYHTSEDLNWSLASLPSGILNEFLEFKGGEMPHDMLRYNGESVVLVDNTSYRNLWSGDVREFDVMSSLYGSRPLDKGKLIWTLSDSNRQLHQSGEIAVANVTVGAVHRLGKIKFAGPNVSKPIKLNLKVRLIGGEYDIDNDWNYWVFPKGASPSVTAAADDTILDRYGNRYKGLLPIKGSDNNLRIVSTLDQDSVDFMSKGGRVVLLGIKPFPEDGTSYKTRWNHMLSPKATVIYDHPLTLAFPHEGWADWQFYPMIDNSKAVNLNNTGIPFDPVIEVVTGFKNLKKESNLFEMRLGSGRLLVCSMTFNLSDAGSAYMLDNILSYASGESFKPRIAVKPQVILRLLGVQIEGDEYVNPMGEAYDPSVQKK